MLLVFIHNVNPSKLSEAQWYGEFRRSSEMVARSIVDCAARPNSALRYNYSVTRLNFFEIQLSSGRRFILDARNVSPMLL